HPALRCAGDQLVSPPSREREVASGLAELALEPFQSSSILDKTTEEMAGRRSHAPGPAQEVSAPMRSKRNPLQGIEVRHSRSCASRRGRSCSCKPTYQASVWSRREQRRIRRTFPTLSAARNWRADAQVAVRNRTLRTPTRETLEAAAEGWLRGAREGAIRNSTGDRYKPS